MFVNLFPNWFLYTGFQINTISDSWPSSFMNCFTTTDVEEKDFTDRRISVNQYWNILSQILLYFSKRTFANSMHVCILIKSVCPKIWLTIIIFFMFYLILKIKSKTLYIKTLHRLQKNRWYIIIFIDLNGDDFRMPYKN